MKTAVDSIAGNIVTNAKLCRPKVTLIRQVN